MAKVFDIKEQKILDDGQNGLCMAGYGEDQYLLKVGRYRFHLSDAEMKQTMDIWVAALAGELQW